MIWLVVLLVALIEAFASKVIVTLLPLHVCISMLWVTKTLAFVADPVLSLSLGHHIVCTSHNRVNLNRCWLVGDDHVSSVGCNCCEVVNITFLTLTSVHLVVLTKIKVLLTCLFVLPRLETHSILLEGLLHESRRYVEVRLLEIGDLLVWQRGYDMRALDSFGCWHYNKYNYIPTVQTLLLWIKLLYSHHS